MSWMHDLRYRLRNPDLLKRDLRFWWQRRTRGWDDSDCWNIDATVAEFMIPRLERFKDINQSYPAGMLREDMIEQLGIQDPIEERLHHEFYTFVIDEIIWYLSCIKDYTLIYGEKKTERFTRAEYYFGRYFTTLWS